MRVWPKRVLWALLSAVIIAVAGGFFAIGQRSGAYGYHALWRRGGAYWITLAPDDARLSPAMRRALTLPSPTATPGPLVWREVEPGFAVAEMAAMVEGQAVDRILLSRIDPARYRFVVRNAAAGDKGLDEWEKALPNAVLTVNGSYFDKKGRPDTPFVSEGEALGPQTYDAQAGAFVAGTDFAGIRPLGGQTWQAAFAGASNAMVSYPLLIGSDGRTHVAIKSRWLANRSFVGQDSQGRILIGSTEDAFFSLERLASFLKDAPLDLTLALNLDGGPIACQSVRLKGYHRRLYARWEAQVAGEQVQLLRWPLSRASWAMPIVLTVERRPQS